MLFAPAAAAATGDFTNLTLIVRNDGERSDLDDGPNNNKVGTNDDVTFAWNFVSNGITDGVITQTLPECWAWDPASLVAVSSNNEQYQSSYEITDDGRTLTVTISALTGEIGLANLVATPSGCADVSTPYTPTVTAVGEDVDNPLTATAEPISVLGEPNIAVAKGTKVTNRAATKDFGDGNEPARWIQYQITLTSQQLAFGGVTDEIVTPFIIKDTTTFSPSKPASAMTTMTSTGDVTLLANGDLQVNSLPPSFYNPDADKASDIRIYLNVYAPLDEVPGHTESPITVRNTVELDNVKTTNGVAVVDKNPNNNTAEGTLRKPDPTSGSGGSQGKTILTTVDPGTPTLGQYVGTERQSGYTGIWTDDIQSGYVSSGATIYARMYYRPNVNEAKEVIPDTNLTIYDFWDPKRQQIIESDPYWVGTEDATEFDPADYVVEYTTGTDASGDWFPSIAAAGGVEMVSGVRMRYTANGGNWIPETLSGGKNTLVFVPAFKVVAGNGEAVTDRAAWVSDRPLNAGQERYTTVSPTVIAVDKTSEQTNVLSGDALTYTLTPTAEAAAAEVDAVDLINLTVTDQLPVGLTNVDFSELDPAWKVDQTGTAETGFKLTFTWANGTPTTDTELPPITFTVLTDPEAPASGNYLNTAVIDVEGNGQAESTRDDSLQLSVVQQQASRITKTTAVAPEIEVNEEELTWNTGWFNYFSTDKDKIEVYDVFPFEGDANGSKVSGTLSLVSATFTGDAVDDKSVLFGTTDPSADVEADPQGANWVELSTISDLSTVTALKVAVPGLAAGYDGGLDVTMSQTDAKGGDKYVNGLQRWDWKVDDWTNHMVVKSAYDVVASSVSGISWWDVNGNGQQDDGDHPVAGVVITATDTTKRAGTEYTTTTAADGSWKIGDLPSGTYSVKANIDGVDGENVVFTTANNGADATDSDFNGTDPISVVLDKDEDLDFDFGLRETDLAIAKTVLTEAGGSDYAETGAYKVNENVTWKIVVANRGETNLSDVTVTDAIANLKAGDATCDALASGYTTDIAAGDSVEITCEATALAPLTNTASATVAGLDDPITDDASITVTGDAALEVAVEVQETEGDDTSYGAAASRNWGQNATWRITVTNNGTLPITDITVKDVIGDGSGGALRAMNWTGAGAMAANCEAVASEDGWQISSLAAGDSLTLVCTSVADATIENLVSATGNFSQPGSIEVTKLEADDNATLDVSSNPAVTVAKTVETEPGSGEFAETGTADWNDVVTWRITITNDGDVPLSNLVVTDKDLVLPEDASAECQALVEGYRVDSIAAGETLSLDCQSIVTESLTNEAVVTAAFTPYAGADSTETSATDTAEIEVDASTGYTFDKLVQKADGSDEFIDADTAAEAGTFDEGDDVTWRFVVTNVGKVTLSDLVLTDKALELADDASAECNALAGDGAELADLTAGESITIECTTMAADSMENVANVTSAELESELSDSAWITVTKKPSSILANTGGNVLALAGMALLLLTAGAILLVARRRRAQH